MLRVDFPRVLIPASAALFQTMADLGQQLLELHLQRKLGVGKPVHRRPPPDATAIFCRTPRRTSQLPALSRRPNCCPLRTSSSLT